MEYTDFAQYYDIFYKNKDYKKEVTFLNKGDIMNVLYKQKDKRIVIDASRTKSIDQDVLEALQEFKFNAEQEGRQQIIFINL